MMKNSIEKIVLASSLVFLLGGALPSFAEENASHKHYKATMPEASHKDYMEKKSEDSAENQDTAAPKHTMRNGVKMTGKAHREHIEKGKQNHDAAKEEDKSTHKHYKATMKGDKHGE